MKRKLINALNEMNDKDYTSLDEALKNNSIETVLDAWLRYEGISGYTSQIIDAMFTLLDVEANM